MYNRTDDAPERTEPVGIRELRREDCPAVSRLLAACFRDPWTQKALTDALEEGDYLQLIAAADEGKTPESISTPIVGYAGMKTVLDEGDITNVCVHPDCRKRGIGNRLMESILRLAVEQGIRRVYLEVRASNAPAILLYRRHGFADAGVRRAYYENPKEDALLMAWEYGSEKEMEDA